MPLTSRSNGFTVVEIAVAIALIAVLIVPITTISIYFLNSMLSNIARSTLESDVHRALQTISNDIRWADSIIEKNTQIDPNSAGWETNGDNGVLVVSLPALNTNQAILENPTTHEPYLNEAVYFIDGSVLKRRSLPISTTGNAMIRTCPQSLSSSSCPADTVLSKDVSSFTFRMYSRGGSVTNNPDRASSLELSLTAKNRLLVVEKKTHITRKNLR